MTMPKRIFKEPVAMAAKWKYRETFGEEYPAFYLPDISSVEALVTDIERRIWENDPVREQEFSQAFLDEESMCYIHTNGLSNDDDKEWKNRWERRRKEIPLNWKNWDPVKRVALFEYWLVFGKEYPRNMRIQETERVVADVIALVSKAKKNKQNGTVFGKGGVERLCEQLALRYPGKDWKSLPAFF